MQDFKKPVDFLAGEAVKTAGSGSAPEPRPLFSGRDGSMGSREQFVAASYPRRLAEAIDSTEYTPVQRAVIAKVVSERRSGIVIGRNGTGKTLVLCRSQVDLMERGVNAGSLNAFEMFERIRGMMDRREDVLGYMRERWTTSRPCLLVDEADKAFGSQLEFLYFAQLVNLRYEEMLQTVVFGNFASWDDCVSKLGQSAFDRLTNGEDGFMADLEGRSFRQMPKGGK